MNEQNYSELTDEKLMIEKKKLKKRKFINALIIGFLASIVAVGIVSWFLGSKKNFIAFLLPMVFPIYFIYLIIKKSKNDKSLEIVLKERNLN
jgi:purine-cytosine permease-like protein|tara:strand:+ start:91 stop:366 length:276 start_codon:yes stop_codon:yes gene_type:complete